MIMLNDDHVHIAHNCKVGDITIITAGAILSGSVEVEPDCWIESNATIIQKSKIGKSSLIGIGSLINSDISPESKCMSLPVSRFLIWLRLTDF